MGGKSKSSNSNNNTASSQVNTVEDSTTLSSVDGVNGSETTESNVLDKKNSTCIGIDFGTTHACVGVFHNDKHLILANNQGFRSTPCVVGFEQENNCIRNEVSSESNSSTASKKNKKKKKVENTIKAKKIDLKYNQCLVGDAAGLEQSTSCLKPFLGQSYSEMMKSDLFDDEMKKKFTNNGKDTPVVDLLFGCSTDVAVEEKTNIEDSVLSPLKFCSIILHHLKTLAEDFTGLQVEHVVLTMPAHFTEAQKEHLIAAAEDADLQVLKVLDDAVAACIAYNLDLPDDGTTDHEIQYVLVYDLGGATHDVSLLSVDHGMFEVLGTAGGNQVGGELFTSLLLDHCIDLLTKSDGQDVAKKVLANPKSMNRLKMACEAAKKSLSQQSRVTIDVDSITDGIDFSVKVSRSRFEEMVYPRMKSTLDEITKVLDDTNVEIDEIDKVILIGGSVSIPLIQSSIKKYFNGQIELDVSVSPDETIAFGATIEATTLFEALGDHLDEIDDVPVVPLNLGFKAADGTMHSIIHRDMILPVSASITCTTDIDDQKTMSFDIYEGLRLMAVNCTQLATVVLTNLTSLAKGSVTVKLTFHLDVEGNLKVMCREENNTTNVMELDIPSAPLRLSETDVQEQVVAAEKNEDADNALVEKLEQEKENARALAIEKTMKSLKLDQSSTLSTPIGEDMD